MRRPGPDIDHVVPLSEALRANFGQVHALAYGILVVLVILFMPDGILGFVKKITTRRAQEPASPGTRSELKGTP